MKKPAVPFGTILLILLVGSLGYLMIHPELWVPAKKSGEGEIWVGEADPGRAPRHLFTLSTGDRTPVSATVSRGRLLVAFRNLNFIEIRTMGGDRIGGFDAYPRGRLQPASLEADRDGRLFLVDGGSRTILRFRADGSFEGFFPGDLSSGTEGEFLLPTGAAFLETAVLVSDLGAAAVKAYLPEGEFLYDLPREGERVLRHPTGMAVTEDGRILVSDPGEKTVAVFSCDGRYAYDFQMTEEGGFIAPMALNIDGLGRVHVADAGRRCILVFDNLGRYLFSYGQGKGESALAEPRDIAIDRESGSIFIVDSGRRSIDVWQVD